MNGQLQTQAAWARAAAQGRVVLDPLPRSIVVPVGVDLSRVAIAAVKAVVTVIQQ